MRRELLTFEVSVSLVEPGYVDTAIATKRLGEGSPAKYVTDGERATYQTFFDTYEANRKKNFVNASPVNVTTDAIVHALTSPTPDTRYVVGDVIGLPAIITIYINWLLPDRVMDLLVLDQAKAFVYIFGSLGAFVVFCAILFRKK